MDEPLNEAPVNVPGSLESDPTLGEHTTEVQPLAPNPVPATAAPSQDAVTINTHLQKVEDDLNGVINYVGSFLQEQDIVEDVVNGLKATIEIIKSKVR